ncbi:TPA: hypothetical protein ACX6SX_001846 [Photobacterium damselae]
MASNILINQLVVVGRNKNYSVKFNPGVNIIYGDSATGKSSILNLIDYLLGAKKFDLYPEIEAAGRYAILDVTLNDDRFSIKRDIFDPKRPIDVFPCSYSEIEKFSSKKYLPNFSQNSKFPDLGFYSDFLLDSLNLNKAKLKEAPTKDDSKLVRLSFRDLFKYCYVDQDDLGSKNFLKPENYVLQTKYKEVFKYIFNTLDSNISSLEGQISEKTLKRNQLDKKFITVSEFLRESEFGSLISLDDEIDRVDKDIEQIKTKIKNLNKDHVTDNEVYEIIKNELIQIDLERKMLIQLMYEQKLKIERFTRLKNDYLNDINKFKASLAANSVIGDIEKEIALCPVCDNELEVQVAKNRFSVTSDDKIAQEINTLKRRVRDTESIVNETKELWEENKYQLSKLDEIEKQALQLQEKNVKELTTPYLVERDMFVSKLGELTQRRKDLVDRLKIRNQHQYLTTNIKSLDIRISKLKEDLEKLKKDAPSMSEVLSNLADHLQNYLRFIKIKSPTDISYDNRTFTPKIRNIEYSSLTSGGLRTIVCIGYLCSLMEEALNSTVSYPSFLMIDTVGKYLGKTKNQKYSVDKNQEKADVQEAVSDPLKYQNIFEYIIKLSEKYENSGKTCQFILVDNDVPDYIVNNLSGFIVAHFSSERINGLPVGFIDDAVADI